MSTPMPDVSSGGGPTQDSPQATGAPAESSRVGTSSESSSAPSAASPAMEAIPENEVESGAATAPQSVPHEIPSPALPREVRPGSATPVGAGTRRPGTGAGGGAEQAPVGRGTAASTFEAGETAPSSGHDGVPVEDTDASDFWGTLLDDSVSEDALLRLEDTDAAAVQPDSELVPGVVLQPAQLEEDSITDAIAAEDADDDGEETGEHPGAAGNDSGDEELGSREGAEMIRAIIGWGNREVEALTQAAKTHAQHLADIHVRLSLMTADTGADAEVWAHHLPHLGAHPLGPGLLLSHGIDTGQRELVKAAWNALESGSLDRDRRAEALGQVAEVWMYRFGDESAAAKAALAGHKLMESASGGSAASREWRKAWARELNHVYMTALAMADKWRDLAGALSERVDDKQGPGNAAALAEAAHVLLDRLDDVNGAAALLRRLSSPSPTSARPAPLPPYAAVHRYRALCMAIDVAVIQPQNSRLDVAALYRQRLTLLDEVEGGGREAAAVRFLLAQHLRTREIEEAIEMLAALAEMDQDSDNWGPHLAAMTGYELAWSREEWAQAVTALSNLAAGGGGGDLSLAYAWRAAELADARAGDPAAAIECWRVVANNAAGSEEVERAIERLLLRSEPEILAAHLATTAMETEAGRDERAGDLGGNAHAQAFALRRAAAVAESRFGDVHRAAGLLTAAIERAPREMDYVHLARLLRRRSDRASLIDNYRALIDKVREPRSSTACLCAIGALAWARGQVAAAEDAFAAAARQAPRDPIARLALAALYRVSDRRRELVTVLSMLVEMVADQELMVELLRELGQLYMSEFNNTRRAREILERALTLDPDDAAAMHGIAQLHDRARQWDKAVELRRRALNTAESSGESGSDTGIAGTTGIDRAALWMEIGEIEERQRKDDEAAVAAYEAAFAENRTSLVALQAQERIYRRQGEFDKLLRVLQAELTLDPEPSRQVDIQLDIAKLASDGTTGMRDSIASLDAYARALDVDPANEKALSGIERIGRAEGRWELLARIYRKAPKTPENLSILAQSLEATEEWSEFVEVRAVQITQAASEEERGRLAHELGDVYYRRLKQIDDAAAMYRMAISCGVTMTASQQALAQMLEERGHWPELASAYEQELATVLDDDVDRRISLLMRLGRVRSQHLEAYREAALAYEETIDLKPHYVPALEALEDIYSRLGDEQDLLRVLTTHATATEDVVERCQLYKRIAEVKQGRGDVDGAIVAYRQAFDAQPSNRAVFTGMEKLCYKQERWNDAMALYNTAIERVEGGLHRAYRLGDLYARRGQVQLQYLKHLDKAAESFLRVIELDPDNDTALKYLESICYQKTDWATLISAYESRAQLASDDERRVETLRRAARVAGNKLKDPVEAARIYEMILDVDTTDKEALNTLERFYERSRDWEKLVGVLSRRLDTASASDTATALLRRIAQICEERLRDPKRAADHYRRILDMAPGNRESLDALGRIFESTEQWTDFIDVTRRQIRVTTDRNMKALLYFKCGSVMEAKFNKEEDAIRYYDAAIKTSPSCLPAVHGLRDLYRRREDWPRVIQTLEIEVKLWQDKKERAGVSAQIGRIYAEHLHDPNMALHYYESALTIDPDCLPANQALFEHYFENQDWPRAKPLAQALAQKAMREGDPDARSEFYRKHGIVNQMAGDPQAGAESLVIALEIKPTNQTALDALGELAKIHPEAYGFDITYRELEKIYRKRDDAESLLGRVRIAQAVMREREGDLDGAAALCEEAAEMCPSDVAILSALVDFHCNMRQWQAAIDAIQRFTGLATAPPDEDRIQAMIRQAEIYADYMGDAERAIVVLREVLQLQPEHQEAHYKLAQELVALHQFDEAQDAIDRAIELAAAPGTPVLPSTLARYYFYRGHIIEAAGDAKKATAQYRRAADYDPGFAEPALALARRAVDNGDSRHAETLLIDAAHSAMEQAGVEAAVPLQRGLARILLASGDRPAAVEAYRGILNVQPDCAPDRVALAEIYAKDDVHKAISELGKVIARDARHAPTYHLLANLYAQSGDVDRARRVLTVIKFLGFAEDGAKDSRAELDSSVNSTILKVPLSTELRQQYLLTEVAKGAMGEIFTAIAPEVTNLFPQPLMGESLVPAQTVEDPSFQRSLVDLMRVFQVEPEVYVGEDVPGGIVIVAYPRSIVVLDRKLLAESYACQRFTLGWAFDSIRGGYALLFNLTQRQRIELGSLLRSLLVPENERVGQTNDFIQSLNKRAIRLIEHHAGKGNALDTEEWVTGMMTVAKRAGLLACDDFGAALRMTAIIFGEQLAPDSDAAVGLGSVLGGADLIRFFLGDQYHRLRKILINATMV